MEYPFLIFLRRDLPMPDWWSGCTPRENKLRDVWNYVASRLRVSWLSS